MAARARGRLALGQAAASGVIVSVLVVQTAVAFGWDDELFRATHRRGYYWPLLDYPMYKGAHHAGEEFARHVIVGTRPDGTELAVEPQDFGLNFWKFEKGPVRALREGAPEALAPFLAAYARRRGLRLTALRLENHPWVFTPRGLERAAPRILATMPVGD